MDGGEYILGVPGRSVGQVYTRTKRRVNASYTEQHTTRRLSVYAQERSGAEIRGRAGEEIAIKTNVSRENSLFKQAPPFSPSSSHLHLFLNNPFTRQTNNPSAGN